MSKPLRIGLIGAGGIAGAHIRVQKQFPEKVQFTAVCDVDEAAARRRAQEVGTNSIYTDPSKMIREADIDAVDLCTPHDQHAPLAITAAGAGKHVLVEKPMACSLQECRQMVEAAEKAGVVLMVAQCQRYDPAYAGVRRLIQEGELGTVYAARCDSMQNLRVIVPAGHWLFDGKRAGGGVVVSVSVHRLDLLRYFIGEVKRVSAVCRTRYPEFINGAEDFACATLEFENGAIGDLFATYGGYRMPYGEQFMLFGEQGAVHAVPEPGRYGGPALVASRKRGVEGEGWNKQYTGFVPVEPYREGLPTDDAFVNEILHFAECCRTGKEPLSSGRDNLGTMKIIFGIYESSRRRQPVDLETL